LLIKCPLLTFSTSFSSFSEIPFNDYFEYYGPDYSINVPANNMVNLNTPEYLEKCKQRIIENLRHCQFAPSVQMQDVPADMFNSDGEAEADEEEQEQNRQREQEEWTKAWDADEGAFNGRTGFNLYRESIRAKERDCHFGDDFIKDFGDGK
jgi:histone deacetylase 1/2